MFLHCGDYLDHTLCNKVAQCTLRNIWFLTSASAAILHWRYEGHENDTPSTVIHFTLNIIFMPFKVLSTCLRLPDGRYTQTLNPDGGHTQTLNPDGKHTQTLNPDGRHTLGSDCPAPVSA